MAFLVPDKIITAKLGNGALVINEKIIPDSARATRDVCSYIKKGQPMKPCRLLSDGTGKPRGITVHNTNDIKVPDGTTSAEQYVRATYPNQAMGGSTEHYYVWRNVIWQQLRDNEQGWHARDGVTRRSGHRGTLIGGNLDTIAIEAIGADPETEETTAKLVAYLCQKHTLDPTFDIYTHNYWMWGKDSFVVGANKNCPIYILSHWGGFLKRVNELYVQATRPADTSSDSTTTYAVQICALSNEQAALDKVKYLHSKSYNGTNLPIAYYVRDGGLFKVRVGDRLTRTQADKIVLQMKAISEAGIVVEMSSLQKHPAALLK